MTIQNKYNKYDMYNMYKIYKSAIICSNKQLELEQLGNSEVYSNK